MSYKSRYPGWNQYLNLGGIIMSVIFSQTKESVDNDGKIGIQWILPGC